MEIKEAIAKIEQQKLKFLENNIDYAGITEAYNMAIHALKKRQARKPHRNEIKYPHAPNMTVVQCPSCRRRLRTKRTMAKGDSYCSDCGQKIEWED